MIISEEEKNRILNLHESYRNWNGSLIKEQGDDPIPYHYKTRGEESMKGKMWYPGAPGPDEREGWLSGRREWDETKWTGEGEYIRSQDAPEARMEGDKIDENYLELQADGTNKVKDEFVIDNPDLQVLHLSDFDQPELKLGALPENLGNLKYIHSLSFPGNPNLTKLPYSILDMKYLSTLNITDTPIVMPQDFWDGIDDMDVTITDPTKYGG